MFDIVVKQHEDFLDRLERLDKNSLEYRTMMNYIASHFYLVNSLRDDLIKITPERMDNLISRLEKHLSESPINDYKLNKKGN